jgi:ribose 5-phosphate isomerase RpiB
VRILHKWLGTKFEGGRHQRRVEKIDEPSAVSHQRSAGKPRKANG